MRNVDRILKQKALAFSLVGVSALGTVFKEQWGIEGGPLLDGLLIACFSLGLLLWLGSKGMERRSRREEREEEENSE
jgi:hypothetical protein